MRLFVAVDLPADVKDAVAAVIEKLRPAAPEAKWVGRDNLHVTLAFLGETPLVDEVSAAVAAGGVQAPPFGSRLEGLGCFPSARRARVIWIGLDGTEGYAAAAASVWRELTPLGFSPEKRPFTAHLTIARLGTPAPFHGELEPPPLAFPVDALTLYRSRLARPAPTYEPILRAPLSGSARSSRK